MGFVGHRIGANIAASRLSSRTTDGSALPCRADFLRGVAFRAASTTILRVVLDIHAALVAFHGSATAFECALPRIADFVGGASRIAPATMSRIVHRIDAARAAHRRSTTTREHTLTCGADFSLSANSSTRPAIVGINGRHGARASAHHRSRTASCGLCRFVSTTNGSCAHRENDARTKKKREQFGLHRFTLALKGVEHQGRHEPWTHDACAQ